ILMESPNELKEQATGQITAPTVNVIEQIEYKDMFELVTTTEQVKVDLTLDEVEGISLYDTPTDIISKLGEPLKLTTDSFFTDMTIYEYEHITIGFYDQQLEYVETVDASKGITIDGHAVALTEQDLIHWLGEPDYIAEDGIVFQRGEALLKLFIDEQSGAPLYASYYHIASV